MRTTSPSQTIPRNIHGRKFLGGFFLLCAYCCDFLKTFFIFCNYGSYCCITQVEAFKGEILGERLMCGLRSGIREVIVFKQAAQILRLPHSLQWKLKRFLEFTRYTLVVLWCSSWKEEIQTKHEKWNGSKL